MDAPGAWKTTQGDPSVVAAILDTGIACDANNQAPNDLKANVLFGTSFIEENPTVCDSGIGTSYHGTHVAGIVAANGKIMGVAPSLKFMPIKVLGDQGVGPTSGIIQAMFWAAGFEVDGKEKNPHPSKVINLSLGASASCGPAYQDAINQLTANNVSVVVSAGNSNTDVKNATPANCVGVISVAATTKEGQRAAYSNYGKKITIAAPGGEQLIRNAIGNKNWLTNGVLSSVNCVDQNCGYEYMQGTSQAAPHVTGIVGLILSIYPNASNEEIKMILTESATAFPVGVSKFSCNAPYECGPGIANAKNAMDKTLSIIAGVVTPAGG